MSSTPYDRQTSFALFSAENPNEQHSGATLDAEFNAIKLAVDDTQQNLSLIQDDDGAVKRGSIGKEQFDASVSIGFGAPGQWASGQIYTAGVDTVFYSSIFYIAKVTHTSGVSFDVAKWTMIADFTAAAAISDGSITSAKLADGAVTANKIGDGSISNAKLATGAVSTAKIADSNVTTAKIADGNVTVDKLGSDSVQTAKISNDNVTYAKMQNVAASSLLGNPTGGAADPSEVTLGAGLGFSGTTLKAVPVVPTIQRFTSGSGTYTTPANVRWIRIRMVGGGAGGGGGNSSVTSTVGGSTTFGGILTAGGGAGASATISSAAGGSASGGNAANIAGGYGGASSGVANSPSGIGGNSYFGGAGGGSPGSAGGTAAAANSGSGGGGGGGNATTSVPGGGGAGGYVEHIITSPAASYAYAVGAGGAGSAGVGGAGTGGAGAAGIIIVEEFY